MASATQVRVMARVAAMPEKRSILNWLARPAKPRFSTPTRLVTGTSTLSKFSQPLLRLYHCRPGRGPRVTPGRSVSISSIDSPPMPGPPVRTAVSKKSAFMAPEIRVLPPLTTKTSPRRSAVVVKPDTSEPPPGSVTAKAIFLSPARTGRATRSSISGAPPLMIGGRAIQGVARSAKTTPEPMRKNSSAKMMRSQRSMFSPVPPRSSRKPMPLMPSRAASV